MRINKVEELVGITKKNIRFYEEKGLLSPIRNAENGYREYSDADVIMLQKIKLLRQLSIPIEEILKLQKGYLTLEDCMRRHIIFLEREEKNIKQKCLRLEGSNFRLGGIAQIVRVIPSFHALNERIFLMRPVVSAACQKEN